MQDQYTGLQRAVVDATTTPAREGRVTTPLFPHEQSSGWARHLRLRLHKRIWLAQTVVALCYFLLVYVAPLFRLLHTPTYLGRPIVEIVLCMSTVASGMLLAVSGLTPPVIRCRCDSNTFLLHIDGNVVGIRCLELLSVRASVTKSDEGVEYDPTIVQSLRTGMSPSVTMCFEAGVESGHPFLRLFITSVGPSANDVSHVLQREAARAEAILVAALDSVQLIQLEGSALCNALTTLTNLEIVPVDAHWSSIHQTDLSSNFYVIRGRPRVHVTSDSAQIGAFLSALLKQGIDACVSCVFSPTTPGRQRRRLEHRWRQIRAREKRREDSLEDHTSKKRLMEEFAAARDNQGWFSVTTTIRLLQSTSSKGAANRLDGIVHSIWGEDDSFRFVLKRPNPAFLLRVLMRRHIKPQRLHTSRLVTFVNTPVQHIPELDTVDLPDFPVPSRSLTDNELFIGWSVYKGRQFNPVGLKPVWLRQHLAVLGATGMGKTTVVKRIIWELTVKTTIPWWVFDVKGSEYADLAAFSPGEVLVFKPGLDDVFVMSLIDEETDDLQNAAHTTFAILREILHERSSSSDLSPAMERMLLVCLEEVARLPDRSAKALIRVIEGKRGKDSTNSLTIDALLNRLEILRREPLASILAGGRASVHFSSLMKRRVVLDLSHVARVGGMDAARILYNLIAKRVFEAALRRGISDGLHHVVVLEEANNLVPESYTRSTAADVTTGESMVMLQRATGQGVIVVATRPTVSSNILANTGTKIVFKLPYDSLVGARLLSLDSEQERYLRTLRRGRAIMTTPVTDAFELMTVPTAFPAPTGSAVSVDSQEDVPMSGVQPTLLQASYGVRNEPPTVVYDQFARITEHVIDALESRRYLTESELHSVLVSITSVSKQEISELKTELITLGTIERQAIGLVRDGFIYTLPGEGRSVVLEIIKNYVCRRLEEVGFGQQTRVNGSIITVGDQVRIIVFPDSLRAATLSDSLESLESLVATVGKDSRLFVIVRGSVAAAKVREVIINAPHPSEFQVIPAFPSSIDRMILDIADALSSRESTFSDTTIATRAYQDGGLNAGIELDAPSSTEPSPAMADEVWSNLLLRYVTINNGRVRWGELLEFLDTVAVQSTGAHSVELNKSGGRRALSELLLDEKLFAIRVPYSIDDLSIDRGLWVATQSFLNQLRDYCLAHLLDSLRKQGSESPTVCGKSICDGSMTYLVFPSRSEIYDSVRHDGGPHGEECPPSILTIILPAAEYADNLDNIPRGCRIISLSNLMENSWVPGQCPSLLDL